MAFDVSEPAQADVRAEPEHAVRALTLLLQLCNWGPRVECTLRAPELRAFLRALGKARARAAELCELSPRLQHSDHNETFIKKLK